MPMYEVEHSFALSRTERDQLAEAITFIHTRMFLTASVFVNIRFTSTSNQNIYIAGKQRPANRIIGAVRAGTSRSADDFSDLAKQIGDAWYRVVNKGQECFGEKQLKVVSIQGSIVAGLENGLRLPAAGEDVPWMAANRREFEKRAAKGDDDLSELLAEMQERPDLVCALEEHGSSSHSSL